MCGVVLVTRSRQAKHMTLHMIQLRMFIADRHSSASEEVKKEEEKKFKEVGEAYR